MVTIKADGISLGFYFYTATFTDHRIQSIETHTYDNNLHKKKV